MELHALTLAVHSMHSYVLLIHSSVDVCFWTQCFVPRRIQKCLGMRPRQGLGTRLVCMVVDGTCVFAAVKRCHSNRKSKHNSGGIVDNHNYDYCIHNLITLFIPLPQL